MSRAKGQGRDKLVESAGALFAQAGYQGVTTKQLAAHAGLSIGALYHHFPSKLDAYRAALTWGVARIAPPEIPEGSGPRARLDALVGWFCSVVAADTVESRLLCLELLDPHLDVPIARLSPFAESLAQFGAIMSEIEPARDAEELVAAIVSLSFGFARLGGLKPQVPDFARRTADPASIAATILRILL